MDHHGGEDGPRERRQDHKHRRGVWRVANLQVPFGPVYLTQPLKPGFESGCRGQNTNNPVAPSHLQATQEQRVSARGLISSRWHMLSAQVHCGSWHHSRCPHWSRTRLFDQETTSALQPSTKGLTGLSARPCSPPRLWRSACVVPGPRRGVARSPGAGLVSRAFPLPHARPSWPMKRLETHFALRTSPPHGTPCSHTPTQVPSRTRLFPLHVC